jgi:hypothetical protein
LEAIGSHKREVRGGKGIKQKKPGYQTSFKEIKTPLTYLFTFLIIFK